MCVHDMLYHMYHYIIQVSSNAIPAFKVVIQHNNTIYPATVLAKPEVHHSFPPSPPVKYKNTKTSEIREHLVKQIGNPAKAEHLMHSGGSFVLFRGVVFKVRTLSFGTQIKKHSAP